VHSGGSQDRFANRGLRTVVEKSEETFRAEFEQGLARLSSVVAQAVSYEARRQGHEPGDAVEESWRERLGAGLVALLGFFDEERHWAQMLLLELPAATAPTRNCRQRLYHLLGELVIDRRSEAQSAGTQSPTSRALTLELVLGGVFSLIAERVRDPEHRPLVELAPSLGAFIANTYRGDFAPSSEPARVSTASPALAQDHAECSSQRPVRATYRTACVLRAIAAAPRSSNRAVAQAAGLTDEGQTSKLLGRLERRGVIENVGLGAAYGEPNEWLLTAYGQSIVNAIGHGFALDATGRGRRRVRGAA
jgi:hypothetical protein